MKAMLQCAGFLVLFGLIQGCAGITHYSKNDGKHFVKRHHAGHHYNWRHSSCCQQTDYYYYSHYSQPRYYREINLAPEACIDQPSRFFYFVPRCGECNWVYHP